MWGRYRRRSKARQRGRNQGDERRILLCNIARRGESWTCHLPSISWNDDTWNMCVSDLVHVLIRRRRVDLSCMQTARRSHEWNKVWEMKQWQRVCFTGFKRWQNTPNSFSPGLRSGSFRAPTPSPAGEGHPHLQNIYPRLICPNFKQFPAPLPGRMSQQVNV